MNLIKQNPYHVIGILADAKQREIAKQKAKIKAFQKVEKPIEFPDDLLLNHTPDRSTTAVEKAFAGIELNQNKLFYALFWFVNLNHLDETALNYLQSGDIRKAEEIWQKTTDGKEVSSKNFSAFNNLGTIKIASAFSNGSMNLESLSSGVYLKTKLIHSDAFHDFCQMVADETYTVNKNKELENFVNALLDETNKMNPEEAKKIPSLFADIHPAIKSFVSEKLTDPPIHNIERKVQQTRQKRNETPQNGLKLARELYRNTKSDLATLSELLGKSDIKYQMIADKYAKELLQCGIDYFKKNQDQEEHLEHDLGEVVMKIFKTAKSSAIGIQTKERIQENIEGLQEWIDNKEERRKEKRIEDDLSFITRKLERFQNLSDTVENADDLVTTCKPKLQNIKSVLGANDDYYLKISSTVVNNAMGMLVTVINEAQTDPFIYSRHRGEFIDKLKKTIRVSLKLGALDMAPELSEQYKKNHATLKTIGTNWGVSLSTPPPQKKGSEKSSKTTYAQEYESNPNSCGVWLFVIIAVSVLVALFL